MTSNRDPQLISVSFEVRYTQGYVFYDRCGQIINDIEGNMPEWVCRSVEGKKTVLERASKYYTINFNSNTFTFIADKASETHPKETIEEATKAWRIVKANLGVTEFYRVACRFNYMAVTSSFDDANRLSAKNHFSAPCFSELPKIGCVSRFNHLVASYVLDGSEYRITISPIARAEAVDPQTLITVEPRALPHNQRVARINKRKAYNQYLKDPMYGLQFDVDCIQYDPETVSVKDVMERYTGIVEKQFLTKVKL